MLFDDPDVGRLPDPTYSVGQLAELLGELLRGAFPGEIWVRGEIRDLSRPQSGHVYFTLVDPGGPQQACLSVMLSATSKERVNRTLRRAGGGVRITDGTEVRVRGRLDWYATRGQLQLRMTTIDPEYTLGALEVARAELLGRLAAEGLLAANTAVALGPVPLRVGLVTSRGSAAEADVLDELRGSGFGFRVVVADARVQGVEAPPSLCAAIRSLAARELDVIAVVRGGGARTDLAAFDDEALARTIAGCAVPVITGIGHETDRSVADEVAHTAAKTPTASAQLLVAQVRAYLDRVEHLWAAAARAGERCLAHQELRLEHAARRARRGASAALAHAAATLDRAAGRATGAARHHLRAADLAAGAASRRVAQRAPRVLTAAERDVAALDARVRALDPARTLARGWSITRRDDGRLVREPADAPAGTVLRTAIHGGELRSRVEGDGPTVDADG